MKSKFYPLTSFLILCSLMGWAQRHADLSVAFVSPSNNSHQQIMNTIDFVVQVKNLGPSNITATDSIGIELILNGDTLTNVANGSTRPFWKEPGYIINAGDSITITKQFAFTSNFQGTITDICLGVYPLLVASDTVKDDIRSNNTSCIKISFITPSGITGTSTPGADISLYPSPANDFIRIASGQPGELDITITDMTGRVMLHQARYKPGSDLFITPLPAGIYRVAMGSNGRPLAVRSFSKY